MLDSLEILWDEMQEAIADGRPTERIEQRIEAIQSLLEKDEDKAA